MQVLPGPKNTVLQVLPGPENTVLQVLPGPKNTVLQSYWEKTIKKYFGPKYVATGTCFNHLNPVSCLYSIAILQVF